MILLPNTGADIAYAMGNLPVVGKLFQVVTFRDYQYESERFDANVEIPQIVVEDVKEKAGETAETTETVQGEQTEEFRKLQETVEQVNFDIDAVTDQLVEEFRSRRSLEKVTAVWRSIMRL